ncbi:MAG: hypothetical protein NTX22_01750 [Ignavibacteriales bacterium]|nr:hypothetical protein [Ignavibacteriales bacterium]
MKTKNLLLLIAIIFCSCSKEQNKYVNVKFKAKGEIILKDTLKYIYSKSSVYVGLIRDIEIIGNNIYISDRANCKIHVFDLGLNYLKSSNGFGHGPSEFASPQYLSNNSGNLIAYGPGEGLKLLDSSFFIVKKIKSPTNYITNFANPVYFDGDKIWATGFNKMPINQQRISDITTVIIFNKEGSLIKAFCNFDKDYDININNKYYESMRDALISEGFNNTYFVLQRATYKYHQFNKKGNYIQTYFYKPKYIKSPPDISISQAKSLNNDDFFKNIVAQTSFYKFFAFDITNNLLFINYINQKFEMMKSRSYTDSESYLCAINKDGECIYDNKIEGYVFAIKDGYIYTVVEESDKYLLIYKYQIIL